MKCLSCGSSDHRVVEGYLVCKYCGSQSAVSKNDNVNMVLLTIVMVLVVGIGWYEKQDNVISEQALKKETPERLLEKNKSSLVINNTEAQIGVQSITIEGDVVDTNIDNSNVKIDIQAIQQHQSNQTSNQYKEMLETKKEMAEMEGIISSSDSKRIAQEYENLHKNKIPPKNHQVKTKLLLVSSVTYANDGKVLQSFSHEYDKNLPKTEPSKVTSSDNGYSINNENINAKKQEVYVHQEAKSRFMSLETQKQ